MADLAERSIGRSLAEYQARLKAEGRSFSGELARRYADRWTGTPLKAALGIRTTLVAALHEHLAGQGLYNIERVSISPITDPLAHDVEGVPVVGYKGVPYRTTHSMIYAKMLACFNPGVQGIFVDSPNIRLELPDPRGLQRGKYLADFSQMDVELRRRCRIGEAMYREEPEAVSAILRAERDRALDFFEGMIVHAVTRLLERNGADLAALGVRLEAPTRPFPRFAKDEAEARHGAASLERDLGRETGSRFFWILGLFRENYDLVYPYEAGDAMRGIASERIFNYDLCAAPLPLAPAGAGSGPEDALEVLSGGLREWLYPAMVERLLDNGVISERPRFGEDGELENIEALEGYGPFLAAARLRGADGLPLFPETFGGGLGIERFLYAILRGPVIRRIEDLTFFGKNPDSGDLYLF
ncbi:MAG: hypothetical protein JNG85_05045 [Spirochaetaceae bacterium]|nr:hypothetical protein [Spirochaetaceae bacterium]